MQNPRHFFSRQARMTLQQNVPMKVLINLRSRMKKSSLVSVKQKKNDLNFNMAKSFSKVSPRKKNRFPFFSKSPSAENQNRSSQAAPLMLRVAPLRFHREVMISFCKLKILKCPHITEQGSQISSSKQLKQQRQWQRLNFESCV